jgi:3-hydroxybutyryl-CoA dehydrogenase
MGAGIAEATARAGVDVRAVDVDDAVVDRGKARIADSLSRAQKAGKLSEVEADAALSRIEFSTDLGSLSDRELVIEAVVEAEAEKVSVFQMLDKIVEDPQAVLASNTSSIPIMKLAMATQRPSQVIGIHFFNPVPVLPLVELVTSLLTSEETTNVANAFAAEQLGKQVIRSQDRAGFIVNALLIPYILSAVRMLESGFATADDIDMGMVKGARIPWDPWHWPTLLGSTPPWLSPSRSTKSSKSRSTRRRRCWRGWSKLASWVASRVGAFTTTRTDSPPVR